MTVKHLLIIDNNSLSYENEKFKMDKAQISNLYDINGSPGTNGYILKSNGTGNWEWTDPSNVITAQSGSTYTEGTGISISNTNVISIDSSASITFNNITITGNIYISGTLQTPAGVGAEGDVLINAGSSGTVNWSSTLQRLEDSYSQDGVGTVTYDYIKITSGQNARAEVSYGSEYTNGYSIDKMDASLYISGGVVIDTPITTNDLLGSGIRTYGLISRGEAWFEGGLEVSNNLMMISDITTPTGSKIFDYNSDTIGFSGDLDVTAQNLKIETSLQISNGNGTYSSGTNGQVLISQGNGALPTWNNLFINNLQDAIKSGTSYYIGENSGSTSTGTNNTFVGESSGYSNTTAINNTFIGQGAGYTNATIIYTDGNVSETHSGENNTFIGQGAGYLNDTGQNNTFIGKDAGYNCTTSQTVFNGDLVLLSKPERNVFIGASSGYNNTTGGSNVFIGWKAGFASDRINSNVFIGTQAGFSNNSGTGSNVFIGIRSGMDTISGNNNTYIGSQSGEKNTTGSENVCIGPKAGYYNNASYNVFIGYDAAYNNTSGTSNTSIGYKSGYLTDSGSNNTSLGYQSLLNNYQGSNNVAIGMNTANNATKPENCIYIGTLVQAGTTTSTNEIVIGDSVTGNGSNTITLGNSSTTELHMPGLQSGASSGDVLTFDGSKIILSSSSGTSDINSLSDAKSTADGSYFIGTSSGTTTGTGVGNTAFGYQALITPGQDSYDTAIGYKSQTSSTGTSFGGNTSVGAESLYSKTNGLNNCVFGWQAGYSITESRLNNAFGTGCMYSTNTGKFNNAMGGFALYYNTTGENNVAIGNNTLKNGTTLNKCIGIGDTAGSYDDPLTLTSYNTSTNTECIYIGNSVGPQTGNTTNEIVIGNSLAGNGSNTITLGNSSTTELHMPGLQSGASSGDVLTFDGSKIILSSSSGTLSSRPYAKFVLDSGTDLYVTGLGQDIVYTSAVLSYNITLNANNTEFSVTNSGVYVLHTSFRSNGPDYWTYMKLLDSNNNIIAYSEGVGFQVSDMPAFNIMANLNAGTNYKLNLHLNGSGTFNAIRTPDVGYQIVTLITAV